MSTPTVQKTKPISPLDQLQVYRVWGTTIAVVTALVFTSTLIASGNSPLGLMTGTSPKEQLGVAATSQQVVPDITTLNDTVVKAFIAELQAATSVAGGEDGDWFNRVQWNRANPCLSRNELPQQYSRRKHVRELAPNPAWRSVLREYANLHRTCMRKVGNATAYFLSRNTSVDCRFTVVDTDQVGLGNRFLVLASAVMYSILTKRVVLLAGDEDFIPAGLLCEPFEGSSWRGFDANRNVTPYRGDPNPHWNNSNAFHNNIDEAIRNGKLFDDYAVANIEVQNWFGQPQSRFYCDTEQEHYRNVTFVYLTGMLYFLPKLFTVPSFRPLLEALFPNRLTLTSLLREVMLPGDEVWARVKRMDHSYLDRTDRRVGVQLRYRRGAGEYQTMHLAIAERVLHFAIANAILPPVVSNQRDDETLTEPKPITVFVDGARTEPRTITVFVASLFDGVKRNLTETFLRHPTATGETVRVVQLSSEGDQKYGSLIYQEALAEIMVLSLSDYLFVTPQSTFSGMAQAYGGLVPWFIDWRGNLTEAGPCTRGQTVDVCFQVPFDYHVRCPYDPERNGKAISEVYPDVQNCLDVDTKGIQLITKNDLSLELQG
jgi:xyloglucan fucosyltransferase